MPELNKKPWEKLSEQLVFDSYRKIMSRLFRLPDNREISYEVFTGQPYAVVAAFTETGDAIMTKQYRPGPETFLWSFPSGIIDPGEKAIDAAKRELLEETGYEAGKLEFIKEVKLNYGDFSQYTFLATDCVKTSEQQLDSTEFIQVELWTVEVLLETIRNQGDNRLVNLDVAYLALDKLGLLR